MFCLVREMKCGSVVGVHLSYLLGRRMEKNRAEYDRRRDLVDVPELPRARTRARRGQHRRWGSLHLPIPTPRDLCISRFMLLMAAISASFDSCYLW
jgi:hypothetical protein